MIELTPDWRAEGACRTADPDLFFPVAVGAVANRQIAKAQRICAGCPVRQQCLDFALRTPEPRRLGRHHAGAAHPGPPGTGAPRAAHAQQGGGGGPRLLTGQGGTGGSDQPVSPATSRG